MLGNWLLGCTFEEKEVVLDERQFGILGQLLDEEVTLKDDIPEVGLKQGMWLKLSTSDLGEESGDATTTNTYHERATIFLKTMSKFPVKLNFSTDAFQVGSTAKSMTHIPRMSRPLPFLGNANHELHLEILDTPGFGDTDHRDDLHLRYIVHALERDVGQLDAVVVVVNQSKFDAQTQQTLKVIAQLCGLELWSKLIIVFSQAQLANIREDQPCGTPDRLLRNMRSEDDFEKKVAGSWKGELVKIAQQVHGALADDQRVVERILSIPCIPLVLFQPEGEDCKRSIQDHIDSDEHHLKKRLLTGKSNLRTWMQVVMAKKPLIVPANPNPSLSRPQFKEILNISQNCFENIRIKPMKPRMSPCARDRDGFKVVGLPTGLQFCPDSGIVSGTPDSSGNYSVTWVAENPHGKTEFKEDIEVKVAPAVPDDAAVASMKGKAEEAFEAMKLHLDRNVRRRNEIDPSVQKFCKTEEGTVLGLQLIL